MTPERRPRSDPRPPGTFATGPLSMENAALFTDLYELTMAASYFREGMRGPATFSLFVRRLPVGRSFLVAAGLQDVLDFLRSFQFTGEALDFLRTLGGFGEDFLEYLRGLRFSGEVRALPEGTVFFADEPVLEVTAPIVEAQLVETAVINLCHYQTLVASKAARSVIAAGARSVVEFGLRRTPGLDAGMKAARSAYLAGAGMSSNVLAGLEYGIPPTGTMAHSYVSAFPHEIDAFRAFARAFPGRTVLLIDTYDTEVAAHKAVAVAREMESRGERLAGVRLDSGDIAALSTRVRRILDEAGLTHVRIFVSGGLDEHDIEGLLGKGAPIDAFGVGTRMDVSADAPYLDMAYKLVSYEGRDVLKTSAGKATFPGAKQIYRFRGREGQFESDLLALADEPTPPGDAEPLLRPVMAGGRLVEPHPTLQAVRAHCQAQLSRLPGEVRRLTGARAYRLRHSDRLLRLHRAVTARIMANEIAPGRRRGREPLDAAGRRARSREEDSMPRKLPMSARRRSPKAGRPPETVASPPRVRRRQKTAHAAFRKGRTILEAAQGPRVALAAKRPKTKKR
jgi:nicotinate phosphoribosyltransferase